MAYDSNSVDIRIYAHPETDGEPFSIKATILKPSSVEWSENFHSGGQFTITYPIEGKHSKEFQRGRFVLIDGYYGGWIDFIEYSASGDESLTVSGFDCLSYFSLRRSMPPAFSAVSGMAGYDAQTGSTESIIKHFLSVNLIDSQDHNKRVPGLRLAPSLNRGRPDDRMHARFKPLSELVAELARDADIGLSYSIDLEAGMITYDCAIGTDRSAGNGLVSPVIFEFQRRNVEGVTLIYDDRSMSNVFYTTMSGEEFEDEALTLTYWRGQDEGAEIPSGLWRRECHMNISVDTPFAGEEYNELKRQAQSQMTQFETVENFTAQINPLRTPYRSKFFLGDIVTVRYERLGITMNVPVTGMSTRVDGGGRQYTATFGTGKVNPFSVLKRDLRNGG